VHFASASFVGRSICKSFSHVIPPSPLFLRTILFVHLHFFNMAFAFAILAFEQYYVNINLANAQNFYNFFGFFFSFCCVFLVTGQITIFLLHKEWCAHI
jgi:hypothetical protein